MTTTRIDHTGHNHPSTTTARTACRKAMKATPAPGVPACLVGNGKVVHRAVLGGVSGTELIGARCGAGLQRGIRKASTVTRIADLPAGTAVSCHRCN